MIDNTKCPLCERWAATPYHKRHTTPTTAQDTENAMTYGFWIASRRPEGAVFRLCERHSTQLFQLDAIENARTAQIQERADDAASPDNDRRREFERRALQVAEHLTAVRPPVSVPGLGGFGQSAPVPAPAPAPEFEGLGLQAPPTQPAPPPEPEVPDTRPRFNCPLCHRQVVAGEVHTC